MGWFEGWFGSSNNDSDPLRRLDPKVREFLEKESPIKYQKGPTASTDRDGPSTVTASNPKPVSISEPNQQPSAVPRESLYQDGRYAHLWKSYRPLAAIEAETKTDNEKLTDVLDAYKDRKMEIGKAALENCALEQLEWNNCMKTGDWSDMLTMCRTQVRQFERCYTVQSVSRSLFCVVSSSTVSLTLDSVFRDYLKLWDTYQSKIDQHR
jgi:hypothetical protein